MQNYHTDKANLHRSQHKYTTIVFWILKSILLLTSAGVIISSFAQTPTQAQAPAQAQTQTQTQAPTATSTATPTQNQTQTSTNAQTAKQAPEVYPVYPKINYGTGPQADLIKRGEYLAKAGDCIACHTTPGGKPYAGGLGLVTPFGTIYSQNITPDKETGIGKWTDEDFVRAVREGISPQGDYYFPAFPYPFFNRLSKDDVLAIRAYLNAVPAVNQPNRPLDMPWPFRVRQLQSFWRFMFFDFHKGEFVEDERKSPEWNRGAYLVLGLAHCGMCHTPINALGAWKQRYALTGAFIQGFHAPDISASGLQDVPIDKIVSVFLDDKLIKGGAVQGPMLEVNHDSLKYLDKTDLQDIATYLKTVKSKVPPAPSHGTGPQAGKSIYDQYCAGCHNMGGGGAPKFGNSGDWAPLIKLGMSTLYKNAIAGIGGMPPKGTCDSCTDQQIQDAVNYIVDNSKGGGGGGAAAPTGPSAAQAATSLAKGQEVYTKVCSVCHAKGQLGAPKLGDHTAWNALIKLNMDVLIERAIDGYQGHPPMGACYHCSDADVIAAVKYMVQKSTTTGDYNLW